MKKSVLKKISTDGLFRYIRVLLILYWDRYKRGSIISCPLCTIADDIRIDDIDSNKNMCYYCPWNWMSDRNYEHEIAFDFTMSKCNHSRLCVVINKHIPSYNAVGLVTNLKYREHRKEEIIVWIKDIVKYIKKHRGYKTDDDIEQTLMVYITPSESNGIHRMISDQFWRNKCTDSL